MSVVTTHAHDRFSDTPGGGELPVNERAAHRYTGIVIAISASALLWVGVGTGIWGLVSVFS